MLTVLNKMQGQTPLPTTGKTSHKHSCQLSPFNMPINRGKQPVKIKRQIHYSFVDSSSNTDIKNATNENRQTKIPTTEASVLNVNPLDSQ